MARCLTDLGLRASEIVGLLRLAAERMEDLADIINVAIEELIRESFELPGFSTLHKEAKRGRAEVNRTLYRRVSDAIGIDGQSRIDLLLAEPDSDSRKTRWDALKQDAQSPTLTHVRDLLERLARQESVLGTKGAARIVRAAYFG